MSLRAKAGRFVAFVSAVALGPALSWGEEVRAGSIFIQGAAALDVSRATRDAMERLQQPSCQQVLEDFRDEEGRPLREKLGTSNPEAYLAALVLREGEIPRGSGRCASPGAAAFTAGGAAVFVCGTSFRRLSHGQRANALIHEMLHTLGLREGSPSSAEITRRVAERCGP